MMEQYDKLDICWRVLLLLCINHTGLCALSLPLTSYSETDDMLELILWTPSGFSGSEGGRFVIWDPGYIL